MTNARGNRKQTFQVKIAGYTCASQNPGTASPLGTSDERVLALQLFFIYVRTALYRELLIFFYTIPGLFTFKLYILSFLYCILFFTVVFIKSQLKRSSFTFLYANSILFFLYNLYFYERAFHYVQFGMLQCLLE